MNSSAQVSISYYLEIFQILPVGSGSKVKIYGYHIPGAVGRIAKFNLSVREDSAGVVERYPRFRSQDEVSTVCTLIICVSSLPPTLPLPLSPSIPLSPSLSPSIPTPPLSIPLSLSEELLSNSLSASFLPFSHSFLSLYEFITAATQSMSSNRLMT